MGKHLDWLTVELERNVSEFDSAHPLSYLIEEAQCHVVASREALMELGLSPEEAEKEAVQRFGSPFEFVRQVALVHQPKVERRFDPATFKILLVAMFFTIFFICLQNAKLPLMWIGWTILGALAIRRMWAVRRLQWEVISLFIPATLALGIIYPLLYLNPSNEVKGTALAWKSGEYMAFLNRHTAELQTALAEIQSLKTDSVVAPLDLQHFPDGQVKVQFGSFETVLEASQVRQTQRDLIQLDLELALMHRDRMVAELKKPLWFRMLRDFRFGALFGLGWAALWLAVTCLVSGARSVFDATTRVVKKLRKAF